MSRAASLRSAYAIRREGWKALTDALGPSGAMRFMMQYDAGYGNYSVERHELFAGTTLEEILDQVSLQATSKTNRDSPGK